jgi:hypothetical protein
LLTPNGNVILNIAVLLMRSVEPADCRAGTLLQWAWRRLARPLEQRNERNRPYESRPQPQQSN